MPRASLLALRKNPRRNHMRFYCMVPAMAIQEQVNRRLEQGEIARTLVVWLNALREVQTMLAAEFGGQPIREQNLSEWSKNGCQTWRLHHRAWEMTQATTSTPDQPLPDPMAGWVTAHYICWPSAS